MEFNDLKNKLNILLEKKNEIMDKCAKEGKSFTDFTEEVKYTVNEIYEIEQKMRLKQSPTMEYGKEWNGVIYTIEEFIEQCKQNILDDETGEGYYATDNAKSDIRIYVYDIIDNIYRNDFTHVIWFNIIKE